VVGLAVALASGSAKSEGNALLWALQAPGAGTTSYLLGTMHVSDPRVLDVGGATREALTSSHTAVFEIITNDELATTLLSAIVYSDGRNLETVLGPELFNKLKLVAQPYGLVPSVLKLMKPWALFTILSIPPEESFRQARGEPALDGWLQDLARRESVELMALETYEEQLAVFEDTPEDVQMAILRTVVEHKPEIEAQYEVMLQRYLDRDLEALFAVATGQENITSEALTRFNQRILHDRNNVMATRLLPLFHEGGYFVAIGAAHLAGEDGVLSQMRAEGFVVTPIE
tara:strand:+ start:4986 stop:5846 length:861 start_codon:yes stop_codon:yes gene_type:complete